MFSRRLDWERSENALARLERERRAAGADLIDLSESNPTLVGLGPGESDLLAALVDPAVATYRPTPRGLPAARAAVAADYERRGAAVDPDAVFLTASSSESYGILFKLLCDPGDAVLVPEPSYPLFDFLARLEGVRPRAYRLDYDGAWHIDFASLAAAAREVRARAVIVVNPNNPTGSFLKRDEWERLAGFCASEQLAVISDEVFADYAAGEDPSRVQTVAGPGASALTFSLGGLSKACGMPQLKLGWIAIAGPREPARAAAERLELIADTYLSVGTPVQLALPRLLALGAGVSERIRGRVAQNRATLALGVVPGSPCTLLASEGAWTAILRVPETRSDEEWATTLLADDDLLVQPGFFFDMPPGAYLVPSLLPDPTRFTEGIRRILARFVI